MDDTDKKKLPWFRFHATDWLTSPTVQLMTRAQKSMLIDLLCYIHGSGNCRLQATQAQAARLLKIFESESEEFDHVWNQLIECPESPDCVTHPKMWLWYLSDRECSKRRSYAGKVSAAKRKSNSNSTGGQQDSNKEVTETQQDANRNSTESQQDVYDSLSKSNSNFKIPDIKEVIEYFEKKGSNESEANKFFLFYDSKGWHVGKNKMQRWKSCASLWVRRNVEKDSKKNYQQVRDDKTQEVLRNAFE